MYNNLKTKRPAKKRIIYGIKQRKIQINQTLLFHAALFFIRKVKQLFVRLIQRKPIGLPLFALFGVLVQIAFVQVGAIR
jgi:hypothetical protein